MFGSEITAAVVVRELGSLPAVISTVGDRLLASTYVPLDEDVPALLTYAEDAPYAEGPIGSRLSGPIASQNVRQIVRIVCEGRSTDPIYDAAVAQLDHLDGERFDFVSRGRSYLLTFTAVGEVPLNTLQEENVDYRQLGNIYGVEVTRGG